MIKLGVTITGCLLQGRLVVAVAALVASGMGSSGSDPDSGQWPLRSEVWLNEIGL